MPSFVNNFTSIKADRIKPSSLPTIPSEQLCQDYVAGFCRRGEHCKLSHQICYAHAVTPPSTESRCAPNYLSLEARLLPKDNSPFDDDGPGVMSGYGIRHDNDHVDIDQIKILPTMDEILCPRPPFMPRKNPDAFHHLPNGQKRHLDVLFRQLRYESIEPLVDASYHASQQLVLSSTCPYMADYDDRTITPRKMRYSLFQDVFLEETQFDPSRGLMVRVSFACPKALRGNRMGVSKHLEEGMLVALIGLSNNATLSITYMEINQRQTTESMRKKSGNNLRAALVLSFAEPDDTDAIRRLLYNYKGILEEQFVLVEVSNLLYAGFRYTLKRLQDQYISEDEIAFLSTIAPSSPGVVLSSTPPAYTKSEGFQYHLNTICTEASIQNDTPYVLRPQALLSGDLTIEDSVNELCERTTLDKGQAEALCETLCRGLALAQGPPGTGKTFLGVALARVLLASRAVKSKKPILVVCLTNHALDSFLADLRDAGVVNFARLGSMSKEGWTHEYDLRKLSSKLRKSTVERSVTSSAHIRVEALYAEGVSWSESLNSGTLSWPAVREHLAVCDPALLSSFTELENVDQTRLSDIRLARKTGGFAFEYWCSGGDVKDVESLLKRFTTAAQNDPWLRSFDPEVQSAIGRLNLNLHWSAATFADSLAPTDLWRLSLTEREKLFDKWNRDIEPTTILDRTAEIHRRHQVAMTRKREAFSEIDLRSLASQDIIAMTTTICARQWPLLKRLGIEIVICEEAAEVMEAQFMCSLLPTVQHSISIGDPLQLRPQVNEMALSLETDIGFDYRLDESLMERLMVPRVAGVAPVPFSRLNLQRRMHPDIANLMRATLYPYLEDHDTTRLRAPVPGMVDRLYWLDHQEPEDNMIGISANPNSFSNSFEVEMIAGLVEYLVTSNEYDYKDISVLTPYNGQLAALNDRFKAVCSLWLSEKDKEALIMEGLLDPEDTSNSQSLLELGNMLRIATIDNFQGEESKVVILSTVRSNSEGRAGFLKTPNRINVGCSRARDGFYIIGNASLMAQTPMWKHIIDELNSNRRIGPRFRTCCPRHPNNIYRVTKPEQWYRVPECGFMCNFKFACGHTCPHKCHASALHERQGCSRPCEKVHQSCGHPCLKPCGESCGDCTMEISTVTLKCGHEAAVTCAEADKGESKAEICCKEVVGSKKLPCGHEQEIICSAPGGVPRCQEPCGKILVCGHKCKGICHECRHRGSHVCRNTCDKILPCGHRCQSTCHEDDPKCPPCQARCAKSCSHGSCQKVCAAQCDLCMKSCHWKSCQHREACTTMCCLPCNQLPCNEPCTELLECGHVCQSLCGETCFCLECITSHPTSALQINLKCGHHFDVDFLDHAVGLQRVYDIDDLGNIQGVTATAWSQMQDTHIRCPTCGLECIGVRRYTIIERLRTLELTIDAALADFSRRIYNFVNELQRARGQLAISFNLFCEALRPGPLAGKHNENLVLERTNALSGLEGAIFRYKEEVVGPFELALTSVQQLFKIDHFVQPFNFAASLRLEHLIYRCRLVVLEENVRMLQPIKDMAKRSIHSELLARGIEDVHIPAVAAKLHRIRYSIADCQDKGLKRLEVELRLVELASLVILNKAAGKTSLAGVSAELELTQQNCEAYPLTAGLFKASCNQLDLFLKRQRRDQGHPIYNKATQEAWWRWPEHATKLLLQCEYGHPYSGKSMAHCAECGPKKASNIADVRVVRPNAKLLSGEDFMTAFKKNTSFNPNKYGLIKQENKDPFEIQEASVPPGDSWVEKVACLT